MIKGVVLVLIATIAWGAQFPIGKEALYALDGFYLTVIRYGTASILFLALLWLIEGKSSFKLEGNGLKVFFFGSMGFAGFSIFAFVGLSTSTPEHAAIILALMPIITVIINMLLKKNNPDKATLMYILIALIGVAMVITRGDIHTLTEKGSISSDLLILIGTTCWVIYTMGGATVKGWSPLRYTALSASLGTITTLVATYIATQIGYITTPSLNTVLSVGPQMLYLILIAGVVAVISWNTGIKILGPVNGILFVNLVPITAFTIGIFQGHRFAMIEAAGALITISALIANNLNARRIAAKATTQADSG
jgi:drug/metabolite transporter (DMT)-like permease